MNRSALSDISNENGNNEFTAGDVTVRNALSGQFQESENITWSENMGPIPSDKKSKRRQIALDVNAVRRDLTVSCGCSRHCNRAFGVNAIMYWRKRIHCLPKGEERMQKIIEIIKLCSVRLKKHEKKQIFRVARKMICRMEREAYYVRRSQAEMRKGEIISLIIDGMDQSKTNLPHYAYNNNPNGKGRIQKKEIINMAIQHIKNLTKDVRRHGALKSSMPDRYLGYKECQDEVMRSLVEVEGWDKMDQLCVRLMTHLEQQGEKFRIMNDESISQIAKEEQYRNADEEQYVPSIKVLKAVCQEHKDFYRDTTLATMQMPPNVPCHTSLSNTETSDLVHSALASYGNAQEMTLEHLKRDKRQWTLFTTKHDSPMIEDSGLSTGSESVAHTNKRSVYKFKHNISKRFYRDEEKASPSHRSSRRSRDDKRMLGHLRSYCTSNSGSSRYPTSDSFYIKTSGSNFENSMVMEKTKASNLLAGFVLHPSGTHYLPLSINLSDMPNDFFIEAQQNPRVYHPINIRVDFCGKQGQSCPTKCSVSADSSDESSCPSEAANLYNKQRTHTINKAHAKS